jgi:hypothetical protein
MKNKVLSYNRTKAKTQKIRNIRNFDKDIFDKEVHINKKKYLDKTNYYAIKNYEKGLEDFNSKNKNDSNTVMTNYTMPHNLYNNDVYVVYEKKRIDKKYTYTDVTGDHFYKNLFKKSQEKINHLENKNNLNEQTIIDLINDKRNLIENSEKLQNLLDEYKMIFNQKNHGRENHKIIIENNKLFRDNVSLHNEFNKLFKENMELRFKIKDLNDTDYCSIKTFDEKIYNNHKIDIDDKNEQLYINNTDGNIINKQKKIY